MVFVDLPKVNIDRYAWSTLGFESDRPREPFFKDEDVKLFECLI